MRLGFTGTRKGLTDQQKAVIELWLATHGTIDVFIHGAAIGADEYMAERLAVWEGCHIRALPCDIPGQVSSKAIVASEEVLPAQNPLLRNAAIVEQSHHVLACPAGMEEELRSGTWATIRCARKRKRPLSIIYPDGTCKETNID